MIQNKQVADILLSQLRNTADELTALSRTPCMAQASIVVLEELSHISQQLKISAARIEHDFKRTGFNSNAK